MENNESVINFINACNELVEGKFILADIKISKILRAISESNEIYNLIAESMINYDFDKEFNKAVVKDPNGVEKFELPEENDRIIPLVFCLLVEIDSKRISFNDFIKAQFPLANNQNEEYNAFAKSIIIPFRNAIAECFGIAVKDVKKPEEPAELNDIIDERLKERARLEEELLKQAQEEENNESVDVVVTRTTISAVPVEETYDNQPEEDDEDAYLLLDRVVRLTRILQDKLVCVRNPLKKSNISLLLDALSEACAIQNVKIIVALIMSLNTFAGGERSMREEIKELNTICYDFYE